MDARRESTAPLQTLSIGNAFSAKGNTSARGGKIKVKETRDKSKYILIVLLSLVLSIVFIGCETEKVPAGTENEFKLNKSLPIYTNNIIKADVYIDSETGEEYIVVTNLRHGGVGITPRLKGVRE